MENIDHNPTDDDEDCGQLVKQGRRSRRMVISDDEETGHCQLAAAQELTKTSIIDSGRETINNEENTGNCTSNNEIDKTVAVSTAADSDSESVEYDVAADVDVEVGVRLFTSTTVNHSLRMCLTSNHQFDDVGDNSAPGPGRENSCTDVKDDRFDDTENSSDDDAENRFDESVLDPSLKAKLKCMKGASKCGQDRQKYSRKAKPKAEEMLEIYSQSQRLLRDSRLSLPYHQPQPKLLADFLARTAQKRQVYAGLHKATDIQKARIICGTLSASPILSSSSHKNRTKFASPQHDPHKSTTRMSPSPEQRNIEHGLHPSVPLSSLNCISKCMASPVKKSGIDNAEVAANELPGSMSDKTYDLKSQGKQAAATLISTDDRSHTDSNQHTPLLTTDPSRELFKSHNSMIDVNEQPPNSMIDGNEQPHNSMIDVNEQPHNSMIDVNEQPHNSMIDVNEQPHNSMIDGNEQPHNSMFDGNEQPQSGHDQRQHICGISEVNSNIIRGGHCSCQCLHASDSTNIHETFNFSDSGNHSTDDLNEGHEPGTNVSHTSQAGTTAGCSSRSLTSPGSCSNSTTGQGSDSTLLTTPVSSAGRQKLLGRLQAVSLAGCPSLSATPDGVICLDDAQPEAMIRDAGLLKLMNRLVQHSIIGTPVTGRAVEERTDPVTDQGNAESRESPHISGYKLERLKQQLGVGMRQKRTESRQRRYDQFALDNEQGFGEEEEECMSFEGSDSDGGEEAEKQRSSDSDDGEEAEKQRSSDTEDEDVNDSKINMETTDSDDDEYLPYLDTEACDDDDDDDDEEQDKNSDVCLHFDVSDEEEQSLQDGEQIENHGRHNSKNTNFCSHGVSGGGSCDTVMVSRSSTNNVESDDDNSVGATNEKTSPEGSNKSTAVVNSLRQWSSVSSQAAALPQHTSQQTDFRRENSESPDLYSTRMDEQNLNSRSHWSNSTDTNLINYLDDDGFIHINETQQVPKLLLLPQLSTISSSSKVFDRLSTIDSSSSKVFDRLSTIDSSSSKVFGATSQLSAGDIFHGLTTQASGKGEHQIINSGLSSGTFVPAHTHSHDDDVIDPFHVLSDSEEEVAHKSQEKEEEAAFSDSDDDAESEADNDGHQCATDDKKKERSQSTDMRKKKTFCMKDFVEHEAELSGSDYESDENVDVAEEDDVLEEEAGDLDLLGISEEKLRDEVGRLHMKQVRDDDDRAVMRYKEMYLQDGDLYSEGAGRMRNFRWRDVDEQSQQETFDYSSDEGQAQAEAEDADWRKDRFEREKFLETEDCPPETDKGQVLKLGQFFLKKQDTIVPATDHVSVSSGLKSSLSKPGQLKVQRKGSFLSRGKESLCKLAEVVQTTQGGHAGKNSRNFLFQTVDGPKDDGDKTEERQSSVPGKRKAHMLCTPDTSKKVKLTNTSAAVSRQKMGQPQQHSSVFDLFKET